MESYCVIRFKDQTEKKQVLMQLMDMDVDLTLTPDLKKFYTDKFHVNSSANVTASISSTLIDRDGSLNLMGRSISTESWANNISCVTPPINGEIEIQPAQRRTFMNMDDHGTYESYLERPVVPKQKIIGNHRSDMDQEKERIDFSDDEFIWNDNTDDIPDADVMPPNQVDIPSPPTTRKSSTKRVNYLMISDSEEEYRPPTKSSNQHDQVGKELRKGKPKKAKCNKCEAEMDNIYSAKFRHVMGVAHTNTMRYECIVNGCGHKEQHLNNMKKHIRIIHKSKRHRFSRIQLTREKLTELEKAIRECFGSEDNSADKCQVCWQDVGGNTNCSLYMKREHALLHTHFMRYKCIEKGCSFESELLHSIKFHVGREHGQRAPYRYEKVQLSMAQKLEIEETFAKCFPN